MSAHLRPQLGRQLVAGRDNNFLQQARFVRRNRIATRAVPEQAHDRGVRAVKHSKDASFGTARAVGETAAALDARQDLIAVHGVAQSVAPDEQIAVQVFARRIRHDEAVTVSMRYQTPSQLIHLRPHSRGGFPLRLNTVPVRRPLLRRGVLRTLFLLGQGKSPVWIFVDIAPLFHFSCELD